MLNAFLCKAAAAALALPLAAPEFDAVAALQSEGDAVQPAEGHVWEFSSSVFYSDPPGSEGHLIPIVYVDRGPLHFEGRYNYEDLHTGSLFAGWKFSAEGDFSADVTPMIGAVVGDTDGIAPGLEVDLGWKRLEWYAEMEYVFDLHDDDDNYFYSWSTLMYGFTESLSAGLVTERTKLVDTDYDLQRGLAIQFQRSNVGISLYAYNLGTDDSYAVVALNLGL